VSRIEVPRLIRLDDFLAVEDEPVRWRVEELMPVGANVLPAAQYKAGKSTLVGNLVRSLVDGEDFLGRFHTEPVGTVALIDNELDERMLRAWYREYGIQSEERVRLRALRGQTASFNLLDPEVREQWADELRGADVLVLDCLRPILDALGLSEDKEAGKFLVALDALKVEAGISESVVVHHMGHSGERSRGDSRLLDWPDVTWKMVRKVEDDPSSERFFSAFGRDVDVPEGALSYDQGERRTLTMVGGSRRAARQESVHALRAEEVREAVLGFVAENPGLPKSVVKVKVPLNNGLVWDAMKGLIDEGALTEGVSATGRGRGLYAA
jgi:hypothetical protein